MRFISVTVDRHNDFAIVKRQDKGYYYAKFYDKQARKYVVTRSTGVPISRPRKEAEQAARLLLEAGVLVQASGRLFLDYLKEFWKPEGIHYKALVLEKGKPPTKAYLRTVDWALRQNILSCPIFKNLALDDLKPSHLEDWKQWAANENGATHYSVNTALKYIKIATAAAAARADIPGDPAKGVKKADYKKQDRAILTAQERMRYTLLEGRDPYAKAVMLLGLWAGLRRGEMRGLLWKNIEDGLISIENNIVDYDGEKAPKCGSARKVPVSSYLQQALDKIPKLGEYVFTSPLRPGKPMNSAYFTRTCTRELAALGITVDEQRKRNLTTHSLRHCFITLGQQSGLSLSEMGALAGHKSLAVTSGYTHTEKVIDFEQAKKKIDGAAA